MIGPNVDDIGDRDFVLGIWRTKGSTLDTSVVAIRRDRPPNLVAWQVLTFLREGGVATPPKESIFPAEVPAYAVAAKIQGETEALAATTGQTHMLHVEANGLGDAAFDNMIVTAKAAWKAFTGNDDAGGIPPASQ